MRSMHNCTLTVAHGTIYHKNLLTFVSATSVKVINVTLSSVQTYQFQNNQTHAIQSHQVYFTKRLSQLAEETVLTLSL